MEQFKYLVVTCRHIAKLLPRPHPQQPPLISSIQNIRHFREKRGKCRLFNIDTTTDFKLINYWTTCVRIGLKNCFSSHFFDLSFYPLINKSNLFD